MSSVCPDMLGTVMKRDERVLRTEDNTFRWMGRLRLGVAEDSRTCRAESQVVWIRNVKDVVSDMLTSPGQSGGLDVCSP